MPKTSLRFVRWEFEERVLDFLQKLNLSPKNPQLFFTAFVHRSVLNEATYLYEDSNERLEFLGDAVLELSITERLFEDFPKKPEGELTDIRSAVVRGRNLAMVAKKLGMSDVIQLSRGEFRVAGHENPYILANAVEALIGAMYLDFGFEVAKKWIIENIYSMLDEIMSRGLYVDPKSYLQELTQELWGQLPTYQVVAEEGQDHNKTYVIDVLLGECVLWRGKGTSKKKWEQDAAENAISNRETWESQICIPRKIYQK